MHSAAEFISPLPFILGAASSNLTGNWGDVLGSSDFEGGDVDTKRAGAPRTSAISNTLNRLLTLPMIAKRPRRGMIARKFEPLAGNQKKRSTRPCPSRKS
jgi:hypothetical protein